MKFKKIILPLLALTIPLIVVTPMITSCGSDTTSTSEVKTKITTAYDLNNLKETIDTFEFKGLPIKGKWVEEDKNKNTFCYLYNKSLFGLKTPSGYNLSSFDELKFWYHDIGSFYSLNRFRLQEVDEILSNDANLEFFQTGTTIAYVKKNQVALEETAKEKGMSVDELLLADQYFHIPWKVKFLKNSEWVSQDSITKVYYNDELKYIINWEDYSK